MITLYHESWEQRGHTRKPNWVVRSIYWIVDWFGDFKFLASALGNAMSRIGLVITNFIILIGVIAMSVAHSLTLLRMAGAKDGLEYVGVVVWELLFIYSSIILAKQMREGRYGLSWAWVGFGMGFMFVEASNIVGMWDTISGRIIGAATPILLLVSKGLLGEQFKQRNTEEVKSVESDITEESNTEPDIENKTNWLGSLFRRKHKEQKAEQILEKKQTVEQITEEQTINNQTVEKEPDTEKSNAENEYQTPSVKQDDQTKNEDSDEYEIEEISIKRTRPKKQIKQSNKKPNNRINHLLNQTNDQTLVDEDQKTWETAIQFINDTKEPPSVRVLAKEAGVTNHRSNKILNELKDEGIIKDQKVVVETPIILSRNRI